MTATQSSDRVETTFAAADEPADIAVLIVTYRSGEHIAGLLDSLRNDALAGPRLRLVVVDNDSDDDTLDIVRAQTDVIAVPAGGNLGYASGINLAMRSAGEVSAYLVLNPDLRVEPGCLPALWRRMRAGAGIVVPAILDADGHLTQFLRREPTLRRSLGDALLGRHWTTRPSWASEVVREPGASARPHLIEWATGAALLVSRAAAEQVGEWDERFFLYSEETDFFRRAREAGFEAWYEPTARVRHWEAGSGRPPELVALTIVNALRYTEKHRHWAALPHRGILLLHELRRWQDPTHRLARAALLDRHSWLDLPQATRPAAGTIDHVLVTRFNLPSAGPESLIRAQDGWLAERVALFEQYTVPSVRAQTTQNFRWLIYFDPLSPNWLVQRLAPLVAEGLFTPVYQETAEWTGVAADARRLTGARGELLLTSNLDNDDALAVDFVERLQAAARPGHREALYLGNGLVRLGDQVFLHHDPHNAFCSVAEPWDDPQTAWRDWHILLHQHMPVRTLGGRPGWLQVIHGRNVSNRVRGRLIDPAGYATLFPTLLEDLPAPSRSEQRIDRLLRRPARQFVDGSRRTAKQVLLATLGKAGLDRLKERLGAGSRT